MCVVYFFLYIYKSQVLLTGSINLWKKKNKTEKQQQQAFVCVILTYPSLTMLYHVID